MASQRRIVITGSRGIAAEVIHACSKRGYSTFIVGGEEEDSRNLAESITRCAGFSAIDLRSESAVESVFALANKELGGITDVIAVAGGSGPARRRARQVHPQRRMDLGARLGPESLARQVLPAPSFAE